MKNFLRFHDDIIQYIVKQLDNMVDVIYITMTCKYLNHLIHKENEYMMAKPLKVHLLHDIYLKRPCWKNHKILFRQMKHHTEEFLFQVGTIDDPVEITNVYYWASTLEVQMSQINDKMLKIFCNNIEKANEFKATFYSIDHICIDLGSLAFKLESNLLQYKKGDLKMCLHYELHNTDVVNTILLLNVSKNYFTDPTIFELCVSQAVILS